MMKTKFSLRGLLLSSLLAFASSQNPPVPRDGSVKTTQVLNHTALLSQSNVLAGQTFLLQNIPFIDIPDQNIQDVYYYRFSVLQRHLRYSLPGSGYIVTEFIQPVDYSGDFNSIVAAAGHHIDEARWLRDISPLDDYIYFWTRGSGLSKRYTNWILDAMYRRSLVTGDADFLRPQLQDMIRLWGLWNSTFDSAAGLYFYPPTLDAQEYSLPGYNISAAYPNGIKRGPNTFRPSLNSYRYANAQAIANVAYAAGNTSIAASFVAVAAGLRGAIYNHLWDPKQQFFVDVIDLDNPKLTPIDGREEVGFYPFRFGVGLSSNFTVPATKAMLDPGVFYTEYGPTTLETGSQWYMPIKPDNYCCYWNGQSWPFSTAHTVKSLAAVYRSGSDTDLTASNYWQYLNKYALTQQKGGFAYVAESHYPLNSSWSQDAFNHSNHYMHSTFVDDVITGIFGIMPRSDNILQISPIIPPTWQYFAIENLPYHGHLISIFYDIVSGTKRRYPGISQGLTVFVDGIQTKPSSSSNGAMANITLQPSTLSANISPINIAANPLGPGFYPTATATYTYIKDWPYKAIDGLLFYDATPDNRWTNFQSTSAEYKQNGSDTITISFARPRTFSSVTLAIYADRSTGGKVDLPSRIVIYGDNRAVIANLSGSIASFVANDRNTFSFTKTTAQSISIQMFRSQVNYYVGLCEIEVWVPPSAGSTLYAVEGNINSASVIMDAKSTALATKLVVSGMNINTTIGFLGVMSAKRDATLSISYSNSATTTNIGLLVNQVAYANLVLDPTSGYKSFTTSVSLASGSNFVTLLRGASGLSIESITIS